MLTVDDLHKAFVDRKSGERVNAMDGVSFTAEAGQFLTILGPSGCGKTTTLRSIAGLEVPDEGEIKLADIVMYSSKREINAPPSKRHLGMVFQSYAIWPHMTVLQNVSFPLKVIPRNRRPPSKEIASRAERALAIVHLEHLTDRQATDLSGGQQQRLALARALVSEPTVLLLDEPLSNLDAALRDETRTELKRLQSDLGVTTVYVTHDQTEALSMSNVVVVMNEGRVEQIGAPREIYEKPASRFVAGFVGSMNFVEGVVRVRDGAGYSVETAHGVMRASSADRFAVGDKALMAIRPEDLSMASAGDDTEGGSWRGSVVGRDFLGESVNYVVAVGDVLLSVRSDQLSYAGEPGAEVSIRLDDEAACSLIRR